MILPKKDKKGQYYLSYSQISSFLMNKKEFIKTYIYRQPIEFTAYIDFGARVGTALEKNDFTSFTPKEQKLLKSIPRLDLFEKEIRVDFPEHNFYIKGYLDTCDKKLSHILDYKTGTEKKISEYQKDDYIQPLLYALGIEQECGKIPQKLGVILIDRVGNPFRGEKLALGEKYWDIELEVTKKRLEHAKALAIKTAYEISNYYKTFLKLNKAA